MRMGSDLGMALGLMMTMVVASVACGDDEAGTTTVTGSTTGTGATGGTGGTGGSGGDGGTGGDGGMGGDGGSMGGAGGGSAMTASASMAGKSGFNTMGTVTFSFDGTEVTMTATITGLDPVSQDHAIHIHETGDCSATDGTSAGGHWNPYGANQHGTLGTGHLGDVGNITADANGDGTLTVTTDLWTVGDASMDDVVGKAVIIHENDDNGTPNPNTGPRISCGVITAD